MIEATALKRFAGFADFTDGELAAMAGHLAPVRRAAGEVLFRQGDPGEAVYLLASGEVDIVIDLPGPDDYTMPRLHPGAIFGEIAPLLARPRSGTAVAHTDAELWQLSFEALRAALQRGDDWAGKFMLATAQTLASRLIAMGDHLARVLAELRKGPTPSPRVAELEAVRKRLMTEWSF